MRLLQLATGPDELIDLHPNVTVVAGLDGEGRRRLADALVGLAQGAVTGPKGLLEAHGVLFDLLPEMLALLDIAAGDLRPVVSLGDLPKARHNPLARERTAAERSLAEVEELWAMAGEEHARATAALAATTEAVDRARRALEEAESDAAGRIQAIDSLTSQLDHAIEQRRGLKEELAELAPRAEQAAAQRAEVEAATAGVRERCQEAAARCSELAARLDQARMAHDPGAEADAEQAVAALAQVEAEVAAERQAEADAAPQEDEPPAERLERVQQRIDELDKRLAAFGPAEVHRVANALERVRSLDGGELVPMPEATALADELAVLETDLVTTSGLGGRSAGLADGRARLDDARQALLEAEQAVRNPELDREMVDRLEQAHADALAAIDKADGRFGGARAQRRADTLRSAEHALLDEMGFTSYSDYMMGYSLLHVDPVKEAALDGARAELSSAEDAWRALQAETDAELARAEVMDRRRVLIEQARGLIGRPVTTGAVVRELRALRVEAQAPPAITLGLRQALDDAGLALGEEDLELDDVVLMAEAWLAEAAEAAIREQEVRADLLALAAERADALAAVEAARAAAPEGPSQEELRAARLNAVREQARSTEDRRRAHVDADAIVQAVTEELTAAAEAERIAAEAAGDADAAVAAASSHEEAALADLRRVEDALATATRAEAEDTEQLRAQSEAESASSPEELAEVLAHAEATTATEQALTAEAASAMAELDEQRRRATSAVESLHEADGAADDTSMAEEIEWYLLARLAAQRSVSLAGSLPLLVDDALSGLDEDELGHVLGRLERMAEAVQVIVVTDDPLASSWALLVGADRAAVVRPQPA